MPIVKMRMKKNVDHFTVDPATKKIRALRRCGVTKNIGEVTATIF